MSGESEKTLEAGLLGDTQSVGAGISKLFGGCSGLCWTLISSLSITANRNEGLTIRDQLLVGDFGVTCGASSSIEAERRILTIVVWMGLVRRQEICLEGGCKATAGLVARRGYLLHF